MLKIQRASAGSGKTYTLAKEFILNLIAFKTETGKWKLRNAFQTEEALEHILAITFTNKATNEMKQRIIKNLSLLSDAPLLISTSKFSINRIPYLEEFINITDSDYNEIANTAKTALKAILNNYSLFKISTIDSFFQEILRTFAFEANINESYQLELDSSFVADAAIDAAIHELDSHPETMGNSNFWLRILIMQESKKSQRWNLFNKKNSALSVYSKIKNTLAQLQTEDFKGIKEDLDSFFIKNNNLARLTDTFLLFQELADNERLVLLRTIQSQLIRIKQLIKEYGVPIENLSKTFINHLDKLDNLKKDDEIDFKYNKIISDQSVFLKKYRSEAHPVDIEALKLYELINEWVNPPADSYFKNWKIYGDLLPYLGIIQEVRTFISKILESNNLLELSDTSFILKKIISDDDSPFIYEKLGNKIYNYLIDEFQDTSQMQWEVIRPLISESQSKGNQSLIIGDPKQSIYRFRNANHSLITDVVPATFPLHTESGLKPEENRNWRSHTLIVLFNNLFFKLLSSFVNEISLENGIPTNFNSLYHNVIQTPQNSLGKGYIEINFLDNKNQSNTYYSSDDDTEELNEDSLVLSKLGDLITDMIKRGYNQKDIGILVNTNARGKDVVEALVKHNEQCKENVSKINFISEESLLVSSSVAVDIIIGILKKIIHPDLDISVKTDEERERGNSKYYNWNNIKTNFRIFSNNNPDLSDAKKILTFLESLTSETQHDSIGEILNSLEIPSLSVLIELLIKNFVPSDILKSEAIYISAFQDLVNEYSANHNNDPASFLEWWYSRGYRASVTSPDNIDAVQIMTIHKSKGLEFKCVIIPFATDSFVPSPIKQEWRWVKPIELKELNLPPFVPVKTSKQLKGSIHEKIYQEYFDQILTDNLNMYYVAFTRAKNELYIFTREPSKNLKSLQDFLFFIMNEHAQEKINLEENVNLLKSCDIKINDEKNKITVGEAFSKEDISIEKEKEKVQEHIKINYFEDYKIRNNPPKTLTKVSKVNPEN